MVMARLKLGCEDDLPYLVDVLGHWRAGKAAPLLLPLLGREKGSLRVPVEAAKALGKMGERRAIEPLMGLLSHRAAIVRRAAYQALREITGQFFGPNKAAWEAWWAEERKEKK
jgi:HEAT repeat protein